MKRARTVVDAVADSSVCLCANCPMKKQKQAITFISASEDYGIDGLVWDPDSTSDGDLIVEKLTELSKKREFAGNKKETHKYDRLMDMFWNVIQDRLWNSKERNEVAITTTSSKDDVEMERFFGKNVDYGLWSKPRRVGVLLAEGKHGPGRLFTRLWEW